MATNMMKHKLYRRQFLEAGFGGLGICLLTPLSAHAYTPTEIKQAARISGFVRYRGRRPGRPPRVKFSGDCSYCRKFDLRQESLLVSKKGGLRYVAVVLEGVARGKPIPTSPPVMAERRCTFEPHLLTITAGSKIELFNDDPVLNTFHAKTRPAGRTLFNVATPRKGQRLKRRITTRGLIEMRCDVHPWEIAHIVSVAHPYHTVTNPDGAFSIDNIPPGRYTLALWHEKLGGQRKKVALVPGGHLKLEFDFKGL